MGDIGHAGVLSVGDGVSVESVTGVGGPVLLARTAQQLDRGDVLAARYQIEALIGTGGSGRVLRAFDRVARELVALKILRPEYATDPVWTERFSRELRVGRQIQHKNVCRIFDIGEADGHRFLSMELATQGTVRGQIGPAALERPLEDRIADARDVIEGVAALHAAGIVHRDVKPENLLRMEDGRLVVSDFGLATDPGSGPATTIMIGTPRYMAHEVVMGDPATARSDVWALGVVLHEILFGARPDRSVVRRGVRKYTLPEVSSLKERRLAELCGRCTEDNVQTRPASSVDVLREFEEAVMGRRLRRGASRHHVVWAAVAVAALATLGLVRDRWTSRAIASSSAATGSISSGLLKPMGEPRDWSKGSTSLATFGGKLHCFSAISGGQKIRAIWGSPRRAEDIDVRTGARAPSDLLPETYVDGCPQVGPNGRGLLFTRVTDSGSQVFLSSERNGQGARSITRGSLPKWLPNGQEFVFSADSQHAAIFSIPTGEMTLVTDGDSGLRQLGECEVDSTGKRLAVRYTTESADSLVVVHSLPGLEVIERARVPVGSEGLHFSSSGLLLFGIDGPLGFGQLTALDFSGGPAMRRVGQLRDADVLGILEIGSNLLVAGHRLKKDLWRQSSTGLERVTWDGNSLHGALSADGQYLVQRKLLDGRSVLVLVDQARGEKQVTSGPLDVTPAFLPDGKSWLYAELNRGQISECQTATQVCKVVQTDTLIPGFPVPDPTGQQIAYLALMNVPRVRVVSRTGHQQRDFGPAGGDRCSPIWTSPTRLWVAQSPSESRMTWVEINTSSGERTGTRRSADLLRGHECGIPSELVPQGAASSSSMMLPISEETSELRRTVSFSPVQSLGLISTFPSHN